MATSAPKRWTILLLGSLAFFLCLGQPLSLFVLAAITVFTFRCGIKIEACSAGTSKRRPWLLGVGVCLVALIATKGAGPIATALGLGAVMHSLRLQGIVLVGLSYYVFQAISYLTDLYLGRIAAERSLGRFALYMAFFPKVTQGPIERAGGFLSQVRAGLTVDPDQIRSGLKLIAIGLFKKLVIADRLAGYVDTVYGAPAGYHGFALLFATYFYAFQIYCDFSGYSDMAVGIGRCFSVSLIENFRAPYLATSISDFWRRWHISLSSWILEYVFKPLQLALRGSGKLGTSGALIVTFVACGLWHGFSTGFIVWGALHGIFMALGIFLKKTWTRNIPDLIKVLATFHLVCLTWIFFRSSSPADGWHILKNLCTGYTVGGMSSAVLLVRGDSSSVGAFLVTLALMACLLILDVSQANPRFARLRERLCGYRTLRFGFWALICSCILLMMAKGGSFIYQRF